MPYNRQGVTWNSELEWAVNDRLIHAGLTGQAKEAMSMLGGVFVLSSVCHYEDKRDYAEHIWEDVQRVIPEARLIGFSEEADPRVTFSVPPDPAKWSSAKDQRGVPYDSKDAPYVRDSDYEALRARRALAAAAPPNGGSGDQVRSGGSTRG